VTTRTQVEATAPDATVAVGGEATRPDASGHFGPYGGRFVPEALVVALDELTTAYADARADPAFTGELDRLLRTYVGRPTPLTDARGLAEPDLRRAAHAAHRRPGPGRARRRRPDPAQA